MSKKPENIKNEIMDQIHRGKIKMRPKIYFVLGAVLTFLGLAISIVTATFIIGLMRFASRSYGPIGSFKLQYLISSFPWWLSLVAIAALVGGILLVRRYDFSYKLNPALLIVIFISAILISGWLVDTLGLNDLLARRGPMQGIMRQHFQKTPVFPDSKKSLPPEMIK